MTTATTATVATSAASEASPRNYAILTALMGLYVALLVTVSGWSGVVEKERMLEPMGAMFALTMLVLLTTAAVRNFAAVRKLASPHYYLTYDNKLLPPDWIERPARTYNNLMQAPLLFHIGCLAMMQVGRVDAGQLALAWIYVATRAVHALLYITWNPLAYRFGTFVMSCICLATLWLRLF